MQIRQSEHECSIMKDEPCIVALTLERELITIDSRNRIYDEVDAGAGGEIDLTKRKEGATDLSTV